MLDLVASSEVVECNQLNTPRPTHSLLRWQLELKKGGEDTPDTLSIFVLSGLLEKSTRATWWAPWNRPFVDLKGSLHHNEKTIIVCFRLGLGNVKLGAK